MREIIESFKKKKKEILKKIIETKNKRRKI